MPPDIKILKLDTLPTAASELYKPSSTDPKQTAIVQNMRFTNIGSGTSKFHLFFVKSGGTYANDARRIVPKELAIPTGYTVIDDDQLTLGSGDAIWGYIDTGTVDYAIFGSERPA